MDGLLLDSERIVQRSWEMTGKQLEIPGIENQIYHTLGMNRAARNAYFKMEYGESFPLETFNQLTSENFYKIVNEEGLPVKTGAKKLLMYAKKQGYKIAVATSSSKEYAKKVLSNAGLYAFFDDGVFGDQVSHAKPDPEIYLKACQNIEENPENCLAFEDAPAGVRSAHAAGLSVIVVPDLVEPTEEIISLTYKKCSTLLEVIPILQKIPNDQMHHTEAPDQNV